MKLKFWMFGAALMMSAGAHTSDVIDKNATTSTQTSGSLWSDQAQNPFKDRTARAEGDLLTILISESSVASFAASTQTQKSDNNSAVQNVIRGLFGFLDANRTLTSEASGQSNGSGTTTQNGSLRARLTAEVVAVTPRGHLIVEGRRSIVVNRETQTFKLTGIVRRDDISANNTVLSESIAQAEIRLEGKGQIANRQRPGLLTQIIDWLF